MRVTIYTDGGCSGNPGPGGWAFILSREEQGRSDKIEGSGGESMTTNNRMELQAVIAALSEAGRHQRGADISVYTDSQYVKNGITSWIKNWKRNGWLTADKKPVKNRELWEKLEALVSELKPKFAWVEGHSGVEGNERCDAMVQIEIGKFRR